jgi:hypothetical protein
VNSNQAKDVLLLYRPGTDDREDPEIAQALELVKRDPELATWFTHHCAFQQAAAGAFDRIHVPEGLRQQILSERKAHFNLGFKKPIAVLAGVLVVLLISAGVYHFSSRTAQNNAFSNFRTRMAGKVLREYPAMDLVTNSLVAIQGFLAAKGYGNYTLPAQLSQVSGTGCAIFPWHGKKVSMICMNSGKNGAPKTPDLFLFVVDRSAVKNPPPDNSSQKTPVGKLATASWSAGDKVYLLAASGKGKEVLLNL